MFSWWKKRKRKTGRTRRLPRRVLAPVEEIVEQGLLVADVAVRMSVKNDIIMNALKRHVDYDKAEIIEMVRSATEHLAQERERDAEHIGRMIGEINVSGRSTWSESDYSTSDNSTLKHRREVYAGVARELRERCEDEAYLAETAAKARDLAWAEIGDSLKERATHPYYSGGDNDEYRSARDDRIQQFIERDLTELIQQQTAKPVKVRLRGRKEK